MKVTNDDWHVVDRAIKWLVRRGHYAAAQKLLATISRASAAAHHGTAPRLAVNRRESVHRLQLHE